MPSQVRQSNPSCTSLARTPAAVDTQWLLVSNRFVDPTRHAVQNPLPPMMRRPTAADDWNSVGLLVRKQTRSRRPSEPPQTLSGRGFAAANSVGEKPRQNRSTWTTETARPVVRDGS